MKTGSLRTHQVERGRKPVSHKAFPTQSTVIQKESQSPGNIGSGEPLLPSASVAVSLVHKRLQDFIGVKGQAAQMNTETRRSPVRVYGDSNTCLLSLQKAQVAGYPLFQTNVLCGGAGVTAGTSLWQQCKQQGVLAFG